MSMGNDIFGIDGRALILREQRATIIASNLVNVSTPNYKAKDLDFQKALASESSQQISLDTTDPKHLQGSVNATEAFTKERPATQAAADGNTVDTDIEQAQFAENAFRYQTSLEFIKSKVTSMETAVGGVE